MASSSLFVRTRYRRIARLQAKSWFRRLINYLIGAEERAPTLDEQNTYSFCRRLVILAFEGWDDPWVAAFYYHYGKHPKKLIPEWLWREARHRRMEIPDYDPTMEERIPEWLLHPGQRPLRAKGAECYKDAAASRYATEKL